MNIPAEKNSPLSPHKTPEIVSDVATSQELTAKKETPPNLVSWVKQHWKSLALLSALGGAGFGIAELNRMIHDPVDRGKVTGAVDHILQQTLGPERALLTHEFLDDLEEFLRKDGYQPGSLKHVFTGDAAAYRQEKLQRARVARAEEVIQNELVSFPFFIPEEPVDIEKALAEQEAKKEAELNAYYQRISEPGSELQQFLTQHPELTDQISEVLAAFYVYPGLSGAESNLTNVELAPLQDQVEDCVLKLLTIASSAPSVDSVESYDALEKLRPNFGKILELSVGALRLTEGRPAEERLQLLREVSRFYTQKAAEYRSSIEPTGARFVSYVDETAQRWLLGARNQLSETPIALNDLAALINQKVLIADDIRKLAEFREALPDVSMTDYFQVLYTSDQSPLENYRSILSIQETFAHSPAAITLSFTEALKLHEVLSGFPGRYSTELLEFLAEENFDIEESALFLAYHRNLQALTSESFSWQDAMHELDELINSLGLTATDTKFALQLSNRYPPGPLGTTKLVVGGISIAQSFSFNYSDTTANQIGIDVFAQEFALFYAQQSAAFPNRVQALTFFAATIPMDTRGAVTDVEKLQRSREHLMKMYADAFGSFDISFHDPTQITRLWENILEKLTGAGIQANDLQELENILGAEVGTSFELPGLKAKLLPLPISSVVFDPQNTMHPEQDESNKAIANSTESELQTGETQLPLVFFEMGGAHSLNAIFYRDGETVRLLNAGIEPSDFTRNIWIFSDGMLQVKRLRELGNTPEEISTTLNTPGFTTAFIPSNLTWDAYDTDPERAYSRKINAVWGWLPSQVIHFEKDGAHQLALLHLDGYGLDWDKSDAERAEYFDSFLAALETQIDGTILEIVPFDPAISAQITVAIGSETHTYAFKTPLVSPFAGGNTPRIGFPASQVEQ